MVGSLVARLRSSRGALQIALVTVVAALVAGAIVGSGLAQTVLSTPDPLTWLANDDGQVTRVNPDANSVIDRLQIGEPGCELQVTQDNSVLVVTDLCTNQVTFVDLALLRISGTRQANAGVKVLLVDGRLYVADTQAGQIELIDALTAATVGRPYEAREPLADVAADTGGALYALGESGRLVTLRWPDGGTAFATEADRQVPDAGPDAVLVAHEQGATAFDPSGSVNQVGTPQERTLRTNQLPAPLVGAQSSPARLVPVSAPQAAAIRLVRDDQVLAVDTAAAGCRAPDQTAVYRNRIYVACPGDEKVVVLDPTGRAVDDLPTPGDPQLVVNAGLLFINVPDAATALVVQPDGTVEEIQTDDPSVPVYDPAARPTQLPADLARPDNDQPNQPPDNSQDDNQNDNGSQPDEQPDGIQLPDPGDGDGDGGADGDGDGGPGDGDGGGGDPTGDPDNPTPTPDPGAPPTLGPPTTGPPPPPPPTTSPPPNDADFTPIGAGAVARPNNSIEVTWTAPPVLPIGYRILVAGTDQQVATPLPDAQLAIINGMTPGQEVSFIVEAIQPDRTYRSVPTPAVSAFGTPGGPEVSIALAARTPSSVTLDITLSIVDSGGRPITSADLTVSSNAENVSRPGVPTGQPIRVTLGCTNIGQLCLSGGDVSATGRLSNEAGPGPDNTRAVNVPPPPGFNLFADQIVMIVSSGGKCLNYGFVLETCNGGQLWQPRGVGDLLRPSDRSCLSHERGSRLQFRGPGDDECENRENRVRWDYLGGAGSTVQRLQGDETSACLTVLGNPAADGTPVNMQGGAGCPGDSRLWFFYRQQDGVPMAAASLASFTPLTPPAGGDRPDGTLGSPAIALLLLASLAAGLVRHRHRKRAT